MPSKQEAAEGKRSPVPYKVEDSRRGFTFAVFLFVLRAYFAQPGNRQQAWRTERPERASLGFRGPAFPSSPASETAISFRRRLKTAMGGQSAGAHEKTKVCGVVSRSFRK